MAEKFDNCLFSLVDRKKKKETGSKKKEKRSEIRTCYYAVKYKTAISGFCHIQTFYYADYKHN